MNIGDWTENFRGTASLPQDVRTRLLDCAKIMHFTAGKTVFTPLNVPDSLVFLVEGTIRVSQSSDTGRDIVLYRVEAGESCVLTMACMLTEEAYHAEGIAETDITAVTLPRFAFDRMLAEEPTFRSFVFTAYSRRLIDMMRVVDDVAFGRVDIRLAERLMALAGPQRKILTTHQQLASELGTAREVISRILQDFSKRGIISQTRGQIMISDDNKLKDIIATH